VNELSLLSAVITDRAAFEKIDAYLTADDFTARGQRIIDEVRAYYKVDAKASRCDTDVLLSRIARDLPKKELADEFKQIFANLDETTGAKNVAQELLELRRSVAGRKLAAALTGPSAASPEKVAPLLERFQALNEAQQVGADVAELYRPGVAELLTQVRDDSRRILLAPKGLNKYINGGVFPGHTIVLFGRVNVGKSTHARNIAAGFILQGKRVLWVENEDTLEDTMTYMAARLIRRPESWMKDNPEEAERMAAVKGLNRFLMPKEPPTTVRDIDAAVEEHKPDCVVVNQMRNMAQQSDEGKVVASLDRLAHQLRFISKRRNVVSLLVTAAREGEMDRNGYVKEKAILEMADCYSSRTGIPAVADLMIGVGMTESLARNNMACLSIVKNKLGGKRNERHAYVKVDTDTGFVTMEDAE
jgi:KaiC/GvpD/RAD55 family RecA-like ATPase